ncbi:MAG: GNAT family N-acetyltransferase [Candidatus Omnitrophota bacterium]
MKSRNKQQKRFDQGVNIIPAKDTDAGAWDGYAAASGTPPMNIFAWKDILRETYGVKTAFFLMRGDNGRIEGILPLYITNQWRGRKSVYSLRFGFVGDNDFARSQLFANAIRFCKEKGITSCLATSGYDSWTPSPCDVLLKKTVVLEIAGSEDECWKKLRDKTRNMVRKSCKGDLVVEEGFDNLKKFYDIYASLMCRKGMPFHSYKFFSVMARRLAENAALLVVKKHNRVLGGTFVLTTGDVAIYPFQASAPDSLVLGPNDRMVWETVLFCRRKGIRLLDMGESVEGSGSYRFKTNFGGIPRDIYYYNMLSTENKGGTKEPGKTKGAAFNAEKLIRLLPLKSMKRTLAQLIKARQRII